MSITILMVPRATVTTAFDGEVKKTQEIDHHFVQERIIKDPQERERFFELLGI
jgi:hypothetical protein